MSTMQTPWHHLTRRSPHAQKLEGWLGSEWMEQTSEATKDFYAPIPIANVPGDISVYKGDFYGHTMVGGFTSLSDLIYEATVGGKKQDYMFSKTGVTGVANVSNTLWYEGVVPAAGADGAALPGGTACVNTTVGGFLHSDPATGDSLHFTGGYIAGSVVPNLVMLYDRIWMGAPTMNTASTQTITYTQARYNGATSCVGNFIFMEVGATPLAATAHNNTVIYTNQAGSAIATTGAVAGVSGAIAKRLDHAQWFIPLAAGDTGVELLKSYTCSATVATGVMNLCLGHPIALLPCIVANQVVIIDGINSAFNMNRIETDACLALLEISKPATTATSYFGQISLCSG